MAQGDEGTEDAGRGATVSLTAAYLDTTLRLTRIQQSRCEGGGYSLGGAEGSEAAEAGRPRDGNEEVAEGSSC